MFPRSTLFQKAEAALLEEKAQKLFGLTRLLDLRLEGDYENLLEAVGLNENASRDEKIRALNRALAGFSDWVAESLPGVGTGYYSLDLDAILTYGPSKEFGDKIGVTIGKDHIGWKAVETGREIVGVGSMVRGDIMNCVRPLVRNGKAIGFIWANETIEGIYRQMESGARRAFYSPNFEPILGLSGLLLFAGTSLLAADSLEAHEFNEALTRIRRYLALFLNSLGLGVIIANAGNDVVFVNQGLQRLTGLPAGALQGGKWQNIAAASGLDALNQLYCRLNDDGETYAMGRFSWGQNDADVLASSVRDAEGRSLGTIFLIEDAKNARHQEEGLGRAEKLAVVGELAAAIAHEIRNPLTIVAGSIQLIPDKLNDPGFLTSFARIAGEELERVNRTVQGLLSFARFSEPSVTQIDVNAILTRTAEFIRPYARKSWVQVGLDLDPGLPNIKGDAEHLNQAFLNLMLNAVQAMPSGGELRASTRYDGRSSFIRVVISDQGLGIPEDDQSKIFDVFFSTKDGGTGLGLSLVHRIIDEHLGFIELDSTVGKGTTFTITLPVALGLFG